MQDTIARYLINVKDPISARALQIIINAVADRLASAMLGSAGIVIFGAASPNAKTGAVAVYAVSANSLVNIAAATVLTPNTGTTLINTFNVYTFYIDNAGVITAGVGVAGTTLGGIVWPNTPQGKAMIGGFTVNPTAASFVGATTALDAANTNVVYFSPTGAVDPSILLS
mgnify:CR=1 FL=1